MFYTVISIEGSKVTARRTIDGRTVCRDASQFKLVNSVINTKDDTGEKADEGDPPSVKTESSMQAGET